MASMRFRIFFTLARKQRRKVVRTAGERSGAVTSVDRVTMAFSICSCQRQSE